ncbi:MAG: hypothetical protein AAF438_03020, partial [Pseudomonadota bacterium]
RKLNFVVIGLLVAALTVSMLLNFNLLRTDAPTVSDASIAVLPFTASGGNEDHVAFADGVHDDLLTMLSSVGDMKVISKSSVMGFRSSNKNAREIARQLGVATLLQGSIQRAGDNVRVNVQLIDAQTDTSIWAKQYDERLTLENIFDIQSKISKAIASALRTELTEEQEQRMAARPTDSLEARSKYLAGKKALEKRGLGNLREARRFFEEAIELDPNYAQAHVGLAAAVDLIYVNHFAMSKEESFEISNRHIEIALDLDDQDPMAYAVRGLMRRTASNDDRLNPEFKLAEADFNKALDLNPNHIQALQWYGGMLFADQQFEAARNVYEHAIELDPLAIVPRQNMFNLLSVLGENETAVRLALETIQLIPDYNLSYQFLSDHLTAFGRLDEAMAWAIESVDRDSDPTAWVNFVPLLRELEQIEQLDSIIKGMPEDHPLYQVFKTFEAYVLGNTELALGRFEAMLEFMDDPPDFLPSVTASLAFELGDCEKVTRYMSEKWPELYQEQPLIRIRNIGEVPRIAYCLKEDGQVERAESLLSAALVELRSLPRLGTAGYGVMDAEVYMVMGEPTQSLAILEEAVASGFRSGYRYSGYKLQDNPILKPINTEPRFVELVEFIDSDIERMRGNVKTAEQTEDWTNLLSMVRESPIRPTASP